MLWRCDPCGYRWVPDGVQRFADGPSIYEHETPIFLRDGRRDYYLDETAKQAAGLKLRWVAQYAGPGGALLDVGANFGFFVHAASSTYAASGLEVSRTAVQWARDHLGVELTLGSIEDGLSRFDRMFQIITMFDVIEHLADPVGALRAVRGRLAPGGMLFISTPNAGSLTARMMGRRWHHYDLTEHIALFSADNLIRLLESVGFCVIARRRIGGRHYRVSYVLDKLEGLGRSSLAWRVAAWGARPLRPLALKRIPLNLGDGLGVVARAA